MCKKILDVKKDKDNKYKELLQRVQQRAINMTRGMEHYSRVMLSSYEDRLRELSLVRLKKRQLGGDLINVHNYLQSRYQEDGPDSVQWCPMMGTRSNRHKWKHSKFYLNMRKNVFTLRVTEQWNRLLREIVKSPSKEIFKTCLETFLCNLLQVNLL